MRGLQTDRTAGTVITGHAFVQNLRRGHYELGVEARPALRVAAAFTELAHAIRRTGPARSACLLIRNATDPVSLMLFLLWLF
jgi:hypothetical protein